MRLVASTKIDALTALNQLQVALRRKGLFLNSKKTQLVTRGSAEYDRLVDVGLQSILGNIDLEIDRGNRDGVQALARQLVQFITNYPANGIDERLLRACINKISRISGIAEFTAEFNPILVTEIERILLIIPHSARVWIDALSWDIGQQVQEAVLRLLRNDEYRIDEWRLIWLLELIARAQHIVVPAIIDEVRGVRTRAKTDVLRAKANVALGKHCPELRTSIINEDCRPDACFELLRSVAIAIQEAPPRLRDQYFSRCAQLDRELTELVKYLGDANTPVYSSHRVQEIRPLGRPKPRLINTNRGTGVVAGQTVSYPLSRGDSLYGDD